MNKVKRVELLAPAGSLESLYAAVLKGADAVYLGGDKFSARAYASNFDEDNMIFAVNYCHTYGVKIYVTVNTLIKEEEIEELIDYIRFLYKIGVDALIVQDTGLIYIIKNYFPDFEIHASTQMTVHNGEGAKFLHDSGMKRIVLSRELSLDEIEYISKDLNIETEIFVHGALCVCYSGQCLMSSMIGGRSGNRGRCAQPCRLPYTLINKDTSENKKAYILSPKDICSLSFLKDVVDSGASSLKIEGRMKRPEYVAGVVSTYRKALENIYEKGTLDSKEVLEGNNTLMQLFNREGFSKAYMFKNEGKDMMAYNFPKNTGVMLGKAEKNLLVKLDKPIRINDGVRINDKGFSVSKIIKDNKEVERAEIGDKVKLLPSNYKEGDNLYKTFDVELLSNLGECYKNPYSRRIYLLVEVKFKVGENITISTVYHGETIEVTGDLVQEAIKKPVIKEKVIENLTKTKDTPFEFSNIEFTCFEEGFMPISSINAVRRDLIDRVNECILKKYDREIEALPKFNVYKESIGNEKPKYEVPKTLVCVSTIEQFNAAKYMGIQDICVDIFNKNNSIDLKDVIESKVYLKIPNVLKQEFESICSILEENLNDIKGMITANLGVINRFKERTNIIGDYKLNIFNSQSLEFYKDVLNLSAISVELNKKELKSILNKTKQPFQYTIYGKIELMVSENCPIGSVMGGKTSSRSCNNVCKEGKFIIKDRMGTEFPVITDKFCRSHIYNSVSTNLIPSLKELESMGIELFRMDFIDESYEETIKVLEGYASKEWKEEFKNYTRGHFKRGVE